jgi:4-hydroxybenzoate polyprenyltransferase
MPQRPSPIRTWLQLFRAPNLFTVPGDPLAGYLLACFGAIEAETLWPAIGASLCFYAGGLLLNDLADLNEDRAERPDRPLPSGAASPAAVRAAAVALFVIALGLCRWLGVATLATGAGLLVAIAAYNLLTKRLPVIGAVNMGVCRGLSMLLGATAVPHGDLTYPLIVRGRLDHLVIAVALVVGFIAAVTHLAQFETKQQAPVTAKWLPLLPLVAGAILFLASVSPTAYAGHLILWGHPVVISARRISAILFLVAGFRVLQTAIQLLADPATPVPSQVGELIRTLLVIQAAFCAAAGDVSGWGVAVALIILWPLSRVVGRWFYAS